MKDCFDRQYLTNDGQNLLEFEKNYKSILTQNSNLLFFAMVNYHYTH